MTPRRGRSLNLPRTASDLGTLISGNLGILAGAVLAVTHVLIALDLFSSASGAWAVSVDSVAAYFATVIVLFIIYFPVLALESLVLAWLLFQLRRMGLARRMRLAGIIGALSMGTPFYVFAIQGAGFPYVELGIVGIFGLLMIVPEPIEPHNLETRPVPKRTEGIQI